MAYDYLDDPSASNYLASLGQDTSGTMFNNSLINSSLANLPSYANQAPAIPVANVLQQADLPAGIQAPTVAGMPAPVASVPVPPALTQVPRTSLMDAIQHIADGLAMAGGPVSQEVLYNRQNHQLDMLQKQGALQQNAIDVAKGQAELTDHSLAKMAATVPILDSAFAQGGVPAMLAAWDKWAPILGQTPDQIAQMHARLQTDGKGTLDQLKQLTTAADKEPTAAQAQIGEYIRKNGTDAQWRQYLEAISNPNAIKPAQQAGLDIRAKALGVAAYRALHPASQVAGQEAVANINPAAVDALAKRFRAGQPIPMGRGGLSSPLGIAIANRAAQLALADAQASGTVTDPAAFVANFKANAAGLQKLTGVASQVLASERTANLNADQVLQTMGAGAGTTGVPVLNAWQNRARNGLGGDPNVVKFGLAVGTLADEYARVVTGGASSGSPTTVHAQQVAEQRINSAQTPQQLQAVIGQMRKEMANRRNGFVGQLNELKSNLGGSTPAAAPSGHTPPAGATKTATGPNGAKAALVNGHWVIY